LITDGLPYHSFPSSSVDGRFKRAPSLIDVALFRSEEFPVEEFCAAVGLFFVEALDVA
jgi:hypothetical protein